MSRQKWLFSNARLPPSFPYTVHETVSTLTLSLTAILAPAVVIALVVLLFSPGPTVPRGTPQSLVWRRRLWELHSSWLGLFLGLMSQWIVVNGLKNLLGKPRPDLLSRCMPDLARAAVYVVGGISNSASSGQLVSADICANTNKGVLDDGFRSFPSGHAATSAAGLIYLSLFIAGKFGVALPFAAPTTDGGPSSFAAFPSRMHSHTGGGARDGSGIAKGPTVAALRLQAASAPLYLLVLCLTPLLVAVFIASSRWFNFRHHGFDIISGFLLGTTCAYLSFRYYHLPIRRGAGWAWGPRSNDRAFWAGVGNLGFALGPELWRAGDHEAASEVAKETGEASEAKEGIAGATMA